MAACSVPGCPRHTSGRDDDANECGPHRAAATRKANRERLEKQLDLAYDLIFEARACCACPGAGTSSDPHNPHGGCYACGHAPPANLAAYECRKCGRSVPRRFATATEDAQAHEASCIQAKPCAFLHGCVAGQHDAKCPSGPEACRECPKPVLAGGYVVCEDHVRLGDPKPSAPEGGGP